MSSPASLFVPVDVRTDRNGETEDDRSGATPVEAEVWQPTELARGPWDPGALHGGPVAALMARAVEAAAPPGDGVVTRFTLELLRPVPLEPLAVSAAVVRPGRRVQLIEAELTAGGRAVARCRALRLRVDDTLAAVAGCGPASGQDHLRAAFPDPDGAGAAQPLFGAYPGFHTDGAELRFARGDAGGTGPAAVWVRLAVPVVPGEEPSPLERTVAAADFGNGVSAALPFTEYTFINADLTVCCDRPARGEWVALEAVTTLGAPGVGLARSVLWDESGEGPLGLAVQCLIVDRR